MDWRSRFQNIEPLPDHPDYNKLRDLQKEIIRAQKGLWYDDLLTAKESKMIVKVDATAYQRSKFKEKFSFRFQSLVDGRQSKLIPYNMREDLGILERYKQTGGPYPYPIDLHNNRIEFHKHYEKVTGDLWRRMSELNIEYHATIRDQYESFWSVYNEYLNSEEWKVVRARIIALYQYRCYNCCNEHNLQVHHLSYKNVGNEPDDDLMCVCRECHKVIHRA